jgi:hypothetical protein
MKFPKGPIIFLCSIFLLISIASPAKAVFGLSKCEKIKKDILIEESIGKKAWQKYDTQRDGYVQSGAMSAQQLIQLFDLLTLVYNSDLIVFDKLDKNPKCTTPSNSADVRAQIQETKNEISTFAESRKIYEKLTLAQQRKIVLPKNIIDSLKTTYESYGSIYGKFK